MELNIENKVECSNKCCRLTVYGKPEGKGRPRFAKTSYGTKVYTPPATVCYEERLRLVYMTCCKEFFAEQGEPVEIDIVAYFDVPASASKKAKQRMYEGAVMPTKKPDWDNIGKIVTDALNGIAWHDDAQIVKASVSKKYTQEIPRIEINIRKGIEL